MTTDKMDALGNDLVVGHVYGYSNSKNGNTTTVIGRLTKINDTRATLNIIKRRRFLWGSASAGRHWGAEAAHASVLPCILFPLSEEHAEAETAE